MKYSIKHIILQQEVLNRNLLKNDKERIVDFFLENVWNGKTQLYYDIEKRVNLNKLNFHKSIPQELKNITKVFYAWGMNIDKDYLNEIKKLVLVSIDIAKRNKVKLSITRN